MHFFTNSPQRERLIVLIWGLLFAKCFILEHYVRIHDVPVNSWLYVWTLSISMAGVATLAFWRMRSTERTPLQVPKVQWMTWVFCLLAAVLLWLGAMLFTAADSVWMIPGFAVLMGIGFTVQSLQSQSLLDWLPVIGWWLTAGLLVRLPTDVSLLTFGLGLLVLVVLPLAVKMFTEWSRARAAVRALGDSNDR